MIASLMLISISEGRWRGSANDVNWRHLHRPFVQNEPNLELFPDHRQPPSVAEKLLKNLPLPLSTTTPRAIRMSLNSFAAHAVNWATCAPVGSVLDTLSMKWLP
jgi:hypothetical protein